MTSDQARTPSVEELRQLPRWALVAFVVRCAQRARPLFAQHWPDAPADQLGAIDEAIHLSATSARAGQAEHRLAAAATASDAATRVIAMNAHGVAAVASFTAHLARAIVTDDRTELARAAEYAANYAAGRARESARFIDEAASAARWAKHLSTEAHRAFVEHRSEAGGLSHSARNAATAANRAAQSAAGFSDHADRIAEARAVYNAYEELLSRSLAEGWTDDTPVDPETLKAVKTAWKDACISPGLSDDTHVDPHLVLHIEAEEGDEQDIAALLIALSDMHRAAGGLGLTFLGEEARIIAREGVPS